MSPEVSDASGTHSYSMRFQNHLATRRKVVLSASTPLAHPADGEQRDGICRRPQRDVGLRVPVVEGTLCLDEARQEVAVEVLRLCHVFSPPSGRTPERD